MDERKGPGDAPPGVQRQIVTRIAITGYFSIAMLQSQVGAVASWEEQATDVKMNT